MSNSDAALIWKGDGTRFYRGVPKCDLTSAEAAAIEARDPVLFAQLTQPVAGTDQALYEVAGPRQTSRIDKAAESDTPRDGEGAADGANGA